MVSRIDIISQNGNEGEHYNVKTKRNGGLYTLEEVNQFWKDNPFMPDFSKDKSDTFWVNWTRKELQSV